MSDPPVVIVHIGMHKTGSTSLQQYLATHRRDLRSAGFVYPRSGTVGGQHAALPGALIPEHPFLPASVTGQDPGPLLDRITDEVPPGFAAILSSEVFWELLGRSTEDFERLHDEMARRWQVRLVYLARDLHDKAFSSLKHMAREGWGFDPVAAYRDTIESTRTSEAHLSTQHPDCTRLPFDGGDSVVLLLDHLASAPVVAATHSTPEQVRALESMAAARRSGAGRRARLNTEFRAPHSAPLTLCVSECLAGPVRVDVTVLRLPRLYWAMFRRAAVPWPDCPLPCGRDLAARLRERAAGDGRLFTAEEIMAVRAWLSSAPVRRRARAVRASRSLAAVLDVLDQTLSTDAGPQ